MKWLVLQFLKRHVVLSKESMSSPWPSTEGTSRVFVIRMTKSRVCAVVAVVLDSRMRRSFFLIEVLPPT
jgi:hypothetical protein